MSKKDFSFHFDVKTKTGKMKIGKKYIDLSAHLKPQKNDAPFASSNHSSSEVSGYGLNLI